jgi:hypothetical protein
LQHLDAFMPHNRPGAVRGANGQIKSERHLHEVHRVRADERLEDEPQKKVRDGEHREGLDRPVDK